MGRHGENIRKRTDGRWEARYIQYHDTDGKAVYRYIYGKSYQEVKQKRKNEMLKEPAFPEMTTTVSKIVFHKLAEEWLDFKRVHVKQSTYAHYVQMLEKHLLPQLGNIYLSAITTLVIEKFLQDKLCSGRLDGKGGLSGKTVSDMRSVLKMILQYAKRKGYFCPSDLDFFAPRVQAPQIEILQYDEQKRLEQILLSESKPLYLGILIALYAGLRIGEVCALQWKDFDFKEGTVNISKTCIRIVDTEYSTEKRTRLLIDKPKTECANRIIPLSDDILSHFQKARTSPEMYILTGKTHFMEPRVCLENYKRILRAASIKDHTFHALRHTFATRCVELGFDIKSLSEIMGHSNISITMQRYVHPSIEQKRMQMNKLSFDSRIS